MPITKPKGRLIMGIIFFILFTLAEIGLVVLTFTKFREKAAWRKNRAIIRAAEVVLLLGMVLVPTTNLKWRFFGALIVLAVRLLIAGIVWLVMRRRNNGVRKKPWTIISCIVSYGLHRPVDALAVHFKHAQRQERGQQRGVHAGDQRRGSQLV